MISAEYVRSRLDYNSETGAFTWEQKPVRGGKWRRHDLAWNSRYAGKSAGNPRKDGYLDIPITGEDGIKRRYLAHRLAWFYVTGEWPSDLIDHADRNKRNNAFCNLREASRAQNAGNCKMLVTNTSGIRGVYWHSKDRTWRAQIMRCGKVNSLGSFKTKEEAQAARQRVAQDYFGEFCVEVAA